MESEVLSVETGARRVTDLTDAVRRFCVSRGDGLCHVFVPHATAGLALIELGSGSERDLDDLLERLLPRDDRYAHRHGSKGHGADHLLPAIVSPSVVLPVADGEVLLGTWQSVVLVDTNGDNPRRQVRLSFVGGT
ncbi:MAG: secondary thiamine-phosphate synthase enzyme YjbQ [Acidimicrobiales bacterium]